MMPIKFPHFTKNKQLTFSASDSRFNSLTTAARASGFTPFSTKLAKIDNVL